MRLGFKLTYQFALRTTHQTIVRPIVYQTVNRQELAKVNENTLTDAEMRQQEHEKKKHQIEQHFFRLKQNDSNPENHIKVRVKKTQTTHLPSQYLNPFIVPVISKQREVLITGTRRYHLFTQLERNVFQSVKKVYPIASNVIGKHIFDAVELMSQQQTKGSKAILSGLQMVRHHALAQGLDDERLYVKGVITNKYRRFRKMRYHAKGRGSTAHRHVSQLRITLEERPATAIFREVIRGRTPPLLAFSLKKDMLENGTSLAEVQKHQPYLTSKGRQQQKLMTKRRAQRSFKESRLSGEGLSYKYIEEKIVDEDARQLAKLYEQRKLNVNQTSLGSRQTLFQKNEKNIV